MYFVNMSQYEFKHPLVINLTGSYKSSIIFASKEQQLEILKTSCQMDILEMVIKSLD